MRITPRPAGRRDIAAHLAALALAAAATVTIIIGALNAQGSI